MLSRLPHPALVLSFSLLTLCSASAAPPLDPAVRGFVSLPAGSSVRTARGDEARALREGRVWRSFLARHGEWRAWWNASTATPHRASGPPIALAGYADDPAAVDLAVRRFIAHEPSLFGSPSLATLASRRVGDVWFLHYAQEVSGIRVLFTDWDFRVNARGELMAFGADVRRAQPTSTRPLLVAAAAREAAHSGLIFDPASDRVEGGDLVLVPYAGPRGDELRLAYQTMVATSKPIARWATLVDANTGEVLWREDRVDRLVSGTVTGTVNPLLPSDPLTALPLPHVRVAVGPDTVYTDANGNYTSAATGTVNVSVGIAGRYVRSMNQAGPSATFSQMVTAPATVNIPWTDTNSLLAERDAYYYADKTHEFIKNIDPGLTAIDRLIDLEVAGAFPCDAFFDPAGNFIGLGGAGDGCIDYATSHSVVSHEYGHFVNQTIYQVQGVDPNLMSFVLSEGMADVTAEYVTDNPIEAPGAFGPGTYVRSAANDLHWPSDRVIVGHPVSQIFSGALWDMRLTLGLPTASRLFHFARYLTPTDLDSGDSMLEFFFDVLTVDDNDGNLANGTPHMAAIEAAFDLHGIGTGFFLSVTHNPLVDQGALTASVKADFSYDGPIGTFDPSSPRLFVSINGGPYTGTPMTITSGTGRYEGTINAGHDAVVRYYVQGKDTNGGSRTSPFAAPGTDVNTFIAGHATQLFVHDMETDQGWILGDPSDDAPTGVWIRDEPIGTRDQLNNLVQTNADHSQSGKLCLVTGNAPANAFFTAQAIRAGKTTVTSPTFSALVSGEPVIEYYRWYTDVALVNRWHAQISNDNGATWVDVENSLHPQPFWRRVLFPVREYVTPTATMKMRFVASSNTYVDDIVEAALDDFRLLSLPAGSAAATAASDPVVSPAVQRLRVRSPVPFASEVTLEFGLASRGPASLRIFDLGGRLVRDLARGEHASGIHTIHWDGRNESGQAVADGVYFARLEAAERADVLRLIRLK